MSEYQFIIIKIKDNTDIYQNFYTYLNTENVFKYFNIDSIECDDISRCLILLCSDEKIVELHWCECEVGMSSQKEYLACRTLYSSSSDIVIKNTVDSIFLDICKDFDVSYITTEWSKDLYEQFERLSANYPYEKIDREYTPISQNENLDDLAQRNEYCKRQYDLKEPTSDGRGEFQRDFDRIIYSKSYRRLVDKTQVFSSSKGDHYESIFDNHKSDEYRLSYSSDPSVAILTTEEAYVKLSRRNGNVTDYDAKLAMCVIDRLYQLLPKDIDNELLLLRGVWNNDQSADFLIYVDYIYDDSINPRFSKEELEELLTDDYEGILSAADVKCIPENFDSDYFFPNKKKYYERVL